MKTYLQTVGCLAATLILGASGAWAVPQTNGQQKCINKINKDTIKVEAAEAKLGGGCVKDAVQTGSDADNCITLDAKGKVSGKVTKAGDDQTKHCGAPNTPTLAYTGAANSTMAAKTAGKAIINDMFGSVAGPPTGPNPPNGLYPCDPFADECLCQRQVTGRVVKIFNATNQIFVKCKKAALSGHTPFVPPGAAVAADIEACADGGNGLSVDSDPKGKIGDATGQLGDTIAQFCGPPANDEFFGGECAGQTGNALRDCLAKRVRCRFCLMVNAADNLALDCDAFDDGLGNASCP